MPIQIQVKLIAFKDEEGENTDADFTIRTRLSHRGQREYMKAVTSEMPDLSEAMNADGTKNPDFKPKVKVEVIDRMEQVLLEDALIDLRNVQDRTGKEIKTWQEFLSFDSFYVQQVVSVLQEIAVEQVKKATPSPKK